MSTEIIFDKMVGAGNDFLIIDMLRSTSASLRRAWPRIASAMCDRRYGIGADGLLVLEPSRAADARMRVFNADGSEAEMCGNGARCVARYLGNALKARAKSGRNGHVRLETESGVLTATLAGTRVRITMVDPSEIQLRQTVEVDGRRIEFGFANTGVPHVVVAVPSVDDVDVDSLGRALRRHAAFVPRGANVNFIEPVRGQANRLKIRTYERGVEGETLACGTGVTASAVIHALRRGATPGRPTRIELETRSGEVLTVGLTVEAAGEPPRVTHVTLEGTAQWICQGRFAWPRRDRR